MSSTKSDCTDLVLFQFSVFASTYAQCACLQGAIISLSFLLTQLNSQTFPSLFFWGSGPLNCMRLSFRSLLYPGCCVNSLTVWCEQSCICRRCECVLCTSDPDEVIYDDVPRDNSDSNTGLWTFSFILWSKKFSFKLPVFCQTSVSLSFDSSLVLFHNPMFALYIQAQKLVYLTCWLNENIVFNNINL